MEVEELREKFLKMNFDEVEFQVKGEDMVGFALACGETAPHYTDLAHPDFRATPTFPARLHGRRMLPRDIPLGDTIPLDAGKAVMPKKKIRPGAKLLGRSHLHDIYEKTGRSGRMIFLVSRMELFDEEKELACIVDSRMVVRERPGR